MQSRQPQDLKKKARAKVLRRLIPEILHILVAAVFALVIVALIFALVAFLLPGFFSIGFRWTIFSVAMIVGVFIIATDAHEIRVAFLPGDSGYRPTPVRCVFLTLLFVTAWSLIFFKFNEMISLLVE